MTKKKRNHPLRPPARALSRQLLADLDEVEALLDDGEEEEARLLLADLNQRFPNNREVLALLLNIAYGQQDMETYQYAAEQILRLTPDDADLTLGLAGAYMGNVRPALALRTAHHFLDRWPDHPRAAEVHKMIADVEPLLVAELSRAGFAGPDAREDAARHEEIQSLLSQGRWAQARLLAEQILRRNPDLVPVLNNLSLVSFMEGRLDDAIAIAERVLARDGDNYHSLSNLTRYFCIEGRMADARDMAARLTAVVSDAPDVWTKIAEGLSYLGDDAGVLDALRSAEHSHARNLTGTMATLYHLAAVASLRLGREPEARKYWRWAVRDAPSLAIALENLEDLSVPVGERHAPWPFAIDQWVSRTALAAYVKALEPAIRRGDDAVNAAKRRFVQQHPEVIPLIPMLLDRGDPEGRFFALQVALPSDLPAVQESLRDFALGQRGPDAMRIEAARAAQAAGLLPIGMTRLWTRGAWRDLPLMGWEIHAEPYEKHRPPVEGWLHEATEALRMQDTARAEQLLLRALEREPDAPDLLNNLSAAYSIEGRTDEAEAIIRRIHERNPDYLHGRANLARFLIQDGKFDEAEALLDPSLARPRLHVSEFSALMNARIELLVARKERQAAHTWLDVWRAVDPDNPVGVILEERLEQAGRSLWSFGSRR
jgi:tetratricopeptide (TPR) repeat protein